MSTATCPVVDFARPSIGEAEIQEVVAVLRSGWLTTGARVARFERAFADYVGAPHAIAVNSCTAALHLSLIAAGVGPGDEVVTTPLTFCATANVVVHVGATPVFADVDPVSMNITPASVERVMTSRTKAILPVHFAGRPVDATGFETLARGRQLAVIEDAAHAVEAWTQGRKIGGGTADLSCFSFYATKNLTTGEGGMVTTARRDWAERIRVASLHGLSHDAWTRYAADGRPHYDVLEPGFKYNMPDIQAALGIHQLASLEQRLERRAAIWARYDHGLRGVPLECPAPVRAGDRHARHLYTVLVDGERCGLTRDELQRVLQSKGIVTSIHFAAVHLHSYYATRYGHTRGLCPNAEAIADRTLSLPLSAAMRDDEVDRVLDAVRGSLA